MKFEPSTHLATVTRSVAYLDRDNKPASDVTLSRIYPASIDDLWDAVTNPDRLPGWFTNVTGDLRLNGRYQVEANASGTITECETQSHFAFTWEFAGETSWVAVSLASEASDFARLTLTHTSFPSPHWDSYGPGATGVGWEMAFLGLALYIANPDFQKPDEIEFATSTEGIAFITGSSNAWCEASIASGTNPESARQAAKQTTAFYTGQPSESG